MRPSKNQLLINALATEIRIRRRELGFSQEDLAGACQLDRPYISLIEVGRKQPTLSVLLRLSDGLAYSLSDLMDRVQRRYEIEKASDRQPKNID
jgi:transcriptional regulator with XRE-family HTH domain